MMNMKMEGPNLTPPIVDQFCKERMNMPESTYVVLELCKGGYLADDALNLSHALTVAKERSLNPRASGVVAVKNIQESRVVAEFEKGKRINWEGPVL